MKQEDALLHILSKADIDDQDPEIIKAAKELADEGLGSFEQCLQTVLES